jgi:hypothetical protein
MWWLEMRLVSRQCCLELKQGQVGQRSELLINTVIDTNTSTLNAMFDMIGYPFSR